MEDKCRGRKSTPSLIHSPKKRLLHDLQLVLMSQATKSCRIREGKSGRQAELWLRKACLIYLTSFSLKRSPDSRGKGRAPHSTLCPSFPPGRTVEICLWPTELFILHATPLPVCQSLQQCQLTVQPAGRGNQALPLAILPRHCSCL